MNKIIRKRLIPVLMVVFMLLPFVAPVSFKDEEASISNAKVATSTDAFEEPEASLYAVDTIYVENKGSVSYGSTYNNQFYVPSIKRWVYCGDADADCPPSGTYEYSVVSSSSWISEVRGILLYAETLSLSDNKNYLGIMRAISNAKHNGTNTLGAEYQKKAEEYIAANYPNGVMSINGAKLGFTYGDSEAVYTRKTITAEIEGRNEADGRVVTELIKLTGSSKNEIEIELPSGLWLKYGNVWHTSGTVKIPGNAQIRFSIAEGDTNTYTLSNLYGKLGCDVYEIVTGSNTQDLYYAVTDKSRISFTIKAKKEVHNEIILSKELINKSCNIDIVGAEYTVYFVKDKTSTGNKYPVARFTITSLGVGEVTNIWDVNSTTSGMVASFTASGKGSGVLSDLPDGVFRIDETKVPEGLTKAASFYVDFTECDNSTTPEYKLSYKSKKDGYTATCISYENAINDPVAITLYKYDANTNNKAAAGNASLENARFEIKFYAGELYDSVPLGLSSTDTWIVKTIKTNSGLVRAMLDKSYVVSHTGSTGYNDDGGIDLTLGTIVITEIQAPKGYNTAADGGMYYTNAGEVKNTNSIILQNKIGADGRLHLYAGAKDASSGITYYNVLQQDAITVYEPQKRYDICFKKTDEEGNVMPGVAFLVTSNTTGEKHVVVTDKNGEFSSAKKTLSSTNANDKLYEEYLETGILPDYSETNLYFYGDTDDKSKADITLGSCYMDEYTVEEIPCKENISYQLAAPVTKQVGDTSNIVEFDFETFVNKETKVKTTTNDGLADKKIIYPEDKEITLIDKVTCSNLNVGIEYTIKGKLMCKETGLLVKRSDGTEVTGETTFVADEENMVEEVEFIYNPVDCGLVGKSTVVFEDLYINEYPVATHSDLEDDNQTNVYPKISTTLTDENGNKEIKADESVKLTDKVDVSSLVVGETFIICGKLINKDTGEVIKNDGSEVCAETTFVADEESMTLEVEYTFNALESGLVTRNEDSISWSDVVCYEYLYHVSGDTKTLVAEHEDINDKNQTISLYEEEEEEKEPLIKTFLSESGTKAKKVLLSRNIKLTDTVKCEDLEPDTNYFIKGKLINKDTKDVILEQEKAFTSDSESCTVDVVYDEFDGIEAGLLKEDNTASDVVCYEYLYKKLDDGSLILVAKHEDIKDKNQTVEFEVKIGTIEITHEERTDNDEGFRINTGDGTPIKWVIISFIISVLVLIILFLIKRGKKNQIPMILIIISICGALSLCTTNVHAQEEEITETSEATYDTDDESTYEFPFAEEKEVDGNTYKLREVTYDKQLVPYEIDANLMTFTETAENVESNYVAKEVISKNGYEYKLVGTKLEKIYKPFSIEAYVDTGFCIDKPVQDETITKEYTDSEGKRVNLTLNYVSTEIIDEEVSKITYTGRIIDYDSDVWSICGNLVKSSPDFELSEALIKKLLKEEGYNTDGLYDYNYYFDGESYKDNGVTCRNFIISANGVVKTKYRFNYAGTFDDVDFSLNAINEYKLSDASVNAIKEENEQYTVYATASYELVEKKEKTISPIKIVISSVIILAILFIISLIIYLIMGGRRNTDAKSKRDIRRDYKNLRGK